MRLAIIAAAAAIAAGACPNQCSAHGSCSQHDLCTCHPNWTGADCSLRVCDFGRAWAVDDNDPHAYAECSGQGSCNRATGECECFDGFEGKACARSSCPGDCSGNGLCKLLSEIDTVVPYDASNWDAQRIQTCVCDPGFFGPDCSQRYCPTGDDPLTLCTSTVKGQVQEVRFTLGSGIKVDGSNAYDASAYGTASEELGLWGQQESAAGQMRLRYVSASGGAYSAHAVPYVLSSTANKAAAHLEAALESVPNQQVKDVKVEAMLTAGSTTKGAGIDGVLQRAYQVTFVPDDVNSVNMGLQNSLECDTGYSCTDAGCQPMVSMPFLYRYGATVEKSLGASATVASGDIKFYAGAANANGAFNAGDFVRMSADSQPQLPAGVSVDTKVQSSDKMRYDMRILIAVMDDGASGADQFYSKVIVGNDVISSTSEAVGYAAGTVGVWGAGKTFTSTLDGFTYNGPLPKANIAVAIPGAPGVKVVFPMDNMVAASGAGRWFEIVVKLPHCSVTPLLKAGDLKQLSDTTKDVAPVDVNVENMECSGRGMCNRGTGECACFEGYYGPACHRQTTLV